MIKPFVGPLLGEQLPTMLTVDGVGALFLLFVGVVVFVFFLGGDDPSLSVCAGNHSSLLSSSLIEEWQQ